MQVENLIRLRTSANQLVSHPISKPWVLEGNPEARIERLSSSADGMASTFLWDCTAGRFNWIYTFDETVHFLEGSVTLQWPGVAPQRVSAGDIVFFAAGTSAEWTVHEYVRKLAFCRSPLPPYLSVARSVKQRLRRMLLGAPREEPGSGLL